ncbi:adenylyltransferase/cytidyltransferase family protein [Gammaproteobacteria bacterium]|jgi:cytidyltransferase-like protein|nr:adenylyltransferase/cytidyltransferase family protein [Gammaproteobacteria bacterium]
MKIVVVSGGFDPIHSGHISYFKSAKRLGEKLIVALNSDAWLIKKKEKFFMPFEERKIIIENLSMVDEVIDFDDDEFGSASQALIKIKGFYPKDEIIFCNGGDRTKDNIPEMQIKDILFEFGVGGEDKKNSSSWILKDYQYDKEERVWGEFYNLFSNDFLKLKELIIKPKQGMSFQKHFLRNEIWFVSKGQCSVNFSKDDPDNFEEISLHTEETFHVQKEAWHQIFNPFDEPCHIIEIQYGEETNEDDIERLRYYKDED